MVVRRGERSVDPKKKSLAARLAHTVLIAILVAFAFGLVVGTLLRRQLDRPVRYMSHHTEIETISVGSFPSFPSFGGATHPGDVRHAPPRVLVAGQHEEQVG